MEKHYGKRIVKKMNDHKIRVLTGNGLDDLSDEHLLEIKKIVKKNMIRQKNVLII